MSGLDIFVVADHKGVTKGSETIMDIFKYLSCYLVEAHSTI